MLTYHMIIIVLKGTYWKELPVNQTGTRRTEEGGGGPIIKHQIPGLPYLSLTREESEWHVGKWSSLSSISYDGRLSHNLRRNGRLRDRSRGREGEGKMSKVKQTLLF